MWEKIRSQAMTGCYALTTLVGAFLVFQVQPVISKAILPWFGGAPAVWTTCLLFFQVVLFCGYAYAHLLSRKLSPFYQGVAHAGLIITALLLLPIIPGGEWKPQGGQNPTWRILLLLAANVGLPYFLLSSTAPLIQSWFSRTRPNGSPYRLYALSNAGSLAALLSYPFVVEPALSIQSQGVFWSLGFCLFALCAGLCALRLRRETQRSGPQKAETTIPEEDAQAPTWGGRMSWLLLPALASVMLLASSNHICQNVAVVPFLWIAPLALYLLPFIICFDRPAWYAPRVYGAAAALSIIAICLLQWMGWENRFLAFEAGLYFSALFFVCMVCHGEMVHRKPPARWLTEFYLMSSAGGALGGIVVALLCPWIFSAYWELNLVLIAGYVLSAAAVLCVKMHVNLRGAAAAALFAGGLLVLSVQSKGQSPNTVVAVRGFFGALRVDRCRSQAEQMNGRLLYYGAISHGGQWDEDPKLATMYYDRQSGVGRTVLEKGKSGPLRIGVVGLGVGTLAAYGRQGDYFRFYDINPQVIDLAQKHFTFLQDSPAEIDLVLGDARLSLEREQPQQFDVLVLDAFSGDAVPAHLLTAEAWEVYSKHLKPDGVIAMHITNRHLDLAPVAAGAAKEFGYHWTEIQSVAQPQRMIAASRWLAASKQEAFFQTAAFQPTAPPETLILWTDSYNNLFQILKPRKRAS